MFVDASAVVAILNRETGFEDIQDRMSGHGGKFYYSPLVRFESAAALARSRSGALRPTPEQFEEATHVVRGFFEAFEAIEISITPIIGDRALAVAAKYGKFVGHDADLNFGDCYSYACAAAYSISLLYKGNDFAQTDMG